MFRKKNFSIKASEVAAFLNNKIYGPDIKIQTFSSFNKLEDNSLTFFTKVLNSSFNINEKKTFDESLLYDHKNLLILIDENIEIESKKLTYIKSNNVRFDFEKVVGKFFTSEEFTSGISNSAIIEKNVTIDKSAYIGPNCYIGMNVSIGRNTKILPNTVINSDTIVGNDCRIKSNTSIGVEGFSFSKKNDDLIHFPHTGKVIIGDDVWIGSSVTIEKGTIDGTTINRGVKIDDLVHIGHNSYIGENSQITVGSIVCGSAILGRDCWLSPGSVIDNGVRIGDKSLIGVNTHIRKNVENNSVVSGNPPRFVRKIKDN